MLNRIIKYFLNNRLFTLLILIAFIGWGIVTTPFNWDLGSIPKDPVPVDAIPDIGENQQIVFTPWKGRSPQDIEDQISYPLTTFLLGIPGVKSIRSSSIFGFSSIYIIFEDDIEFYWSRSRIIEKLNSLPKGLLPNDVQPALGPDATSLGQIYWYTLEGRDNKGNPTGGWDLHEIRSVQDFYVKYALNSSEGVSEVASIGGFVQEYQIDVNPEALKAYDIPLHSVMKAVQMANKDVGAKTIEINQAEYLVRGLGYIKTIKDIENAVVSVSDNVPIRIKNIAVVNLGPSSRRGVLDKDGAEVVGGVVVARYGSNPLEVINQVKAKIKEISPGLPKKILSDGSESQLTIIPFYDRSKLIKETLGTLEEALSLEILITILVIIVMIYNLRASLLISSLLPISVLMVFIAMRYFGVDANIVALSGIAIAIGTMVDLGIILSENIVKNINEAPPEHKLIDRIYNGSKEVGGAILTAVSTTIVSFIPVFTMEAAEGKLFGPLAFTKTFALIAALIVTLLILPTLAYWLFGFKIKNKKIRQSLSFVLIIIGLIAVSKAMLFLGILLIFYGLGNMLKSFFKRKRFFKTKIISLVTNNFNIILSLFAVIWLLARFWLPLGPQKHILLNFIFVGVLLGGVLLFFHFIFSKYQKILRWCLTNKGLFLSLPTSLILLGVIVWLGFNSIFGFVAQGFDKIGVNIRTNAVWSGLIHTFPGTEKEFMPSLDEGSFLLMPTSMPHSGIEYNRKVLGQLDMLITQIPEVALSVGKLGRVDSALDPAPISMFENVINYKSEYVQNDKGHPLRFKTDKEGRFITKNGVPMTHNQALESGLESQFLIPDNKGRYFRNWRDHIRSPDDIWNEIVQVIKIPGVTSAPKLQPIETRLVMLQTGMRAPMGIKVYGPDLPTIEAFGVELEKLLKQVPSVKKEAVFADRIVGKPYIHLAIDRTKIARYGLSIQEVQQFIETAIGGKELGSTVEGRERYSIRVRYPRELRDNVEALDKILIPTPTGVQIPMSHIVDIQYVQGPQAIKSEETFLVGYVLFDRHPNFSEVAVVNAAQNYINTQIKEGKLNVPAGISFKFSGNYENQVRAEKRLSLVVPLVLIIVFMILYFQFKSASTSLMVYSGIMMAFSGGFILLWLYSQSWFLDLEVLGTNMRSLFQVQPINLSVAVWVGFIALFGIATDDGVLMATYLNQSFERNKPSTLPELRAAVIEGGMRRIRPAVMTSATTIIALLPVLSSSGRGADIMIPMAIPAFGGMMMAAITYFIVPVLYSLREEYKLKKQTS